MNSIELIEGYDKVNYGSYDLKKNYQKFMTKALIIGITFHLVAIGTYYAALYVKEHMTTVRITDINELLNAPPLLDAPPPPDVKVDAPETKSVSSIPLVVLDEEADVGATIMTQDEIKTEIVSPLKYGGDEIKVDITGTISDIGSSDEPDINAFVPVEQQPVLLAKLKIEYPELAKQAGLEGKVIAKVLVDESGNVVKVVVISGEDIFKEAAIQVLKNAKFKPAIQNNRPVKLWITYPITFRLK
jgi:periplasmic protein TonB